MKDTSHIPLSTELRCERSIGRAAQDYLACGYGVIPLCGKLPTIHWKEFQTRLATQVEAAAWFGGQENPPTGVGIVTGKLSGLVVVDCDSRDDAAADRLAILNDRAGVWRCRTIFNCTDACPREIDVTKAIEDVKRALVLSRV